MLLGKDDVIRDVCPAYETDALVRRVNVNRYDDREIVDTNLIESYDRLMEFVRKHLPDKFFLEDDQRKNLRNIIAREMVGNILIHREYSSSYIAKLVIEQNRMYTENANRAAQDGFLTPDNIEPNPKNPIIASFFRTIGWSDRLGSGVRNLFKYTKFYSGADPEFHEGDVFRLNVPLDDSYSYDMEIERKSDSATKIGDKKSATKIGDKKSATTEKHIKVILSTMENGREYKVDEIAKIIGLKASRTRELLKMLVDDNKLEIIGNKKIGGI